VVQTPIGAITNVYLLGAADSFLPVDSQSSIEEDSQPLIQNQCDEHVPKPSPSPLLHEGDEKGPWLQPSQAGNMKLVYVYCCAFRVCWDFRGSTRPALNMIFFRRLTSPSPTPLRLTAFQQFFVR